MSSEFDLRKVYTQILSKERIIECINNSYDKEFIVSFLPRTKDNADILIRSLKLDCKKDEEGCRRCIVSEQNVYCGDINPNDDSIVLCNKCVKDKENAQ